MFAPWVLHLGRTPDEIGGGIWVKLAILALMGSGMPIPEGGSEMLARALAQLVVDQGGVIRTNTQVSRIIVENGRAVKVRTSSNEEFQARQAIIASTNPDQLYLSVFRDMTPEMKKAE
jgi:phytoene dehydrogenase-like protein